MRDKKKHTLLRFNTFLLVSSIFSWDHATKIRGKWIEFEWYTPYEFDADSWWIDFTKSQYTGVLQKKTYTEQRQLDIYAVCDMNTDFDMNVWWNSKRGLSAKLIELLAYSSVAQWNRFWICLMHQSLMLPAKKNTADIQHMLAVFKKYDFHIQQNHRNNQAHYTGFDKKMIFYITSSHTDTKHIQMLSQKNDVIVIHLFHHFENYLNGNWVVWLSQNWKKFYIDLDDIEKKEQYIQLRQSHISEFRSKVLQCWAEYLYLDTHSDVYKQLSQLFYRRTHA